MESVIPVTLMPLFSNSSCIFAIPWWFLLPAVLPDKAACSPAVLGEAPIDCSPSTQTQFAGDAYSHNSWLLNTDLYCHPIHSPVGRGDVEGITLRHSAVIFQRWFVTIPFVITLLLWDIHRTGFMGWICPVWWSVIMWKKQEMEIDIFCHLKDIWEEHPWC